MTMVRKNISRWVRNEPSPNGPTIYDTTHAGCLERPGTTNVPKRTIQGLLRVWSPK